ncbi:MAG: hypothetical protein QM753_17610 [Thermomicrobiales bacterium]
MALKSPTSLLSGLADPGVMFSQDVMEDPDVAPELAHPDNKTPILRIYRRGEGPLGEPDIVTRRTEAYIIGWDDVEPWPDEA